MTGMVAASDDEHTNCVRAFVQGLEDIWKASRANPLPEELVQKAYDCLKTSFVSKPTFSLQIKPIEIYCADKSVYSNKVPRNSVSFFFYDGGLRSLQFKSGMNIQEFKEILQILSTDFYRPESMDKDLFTLFAENIFDHLEVFGEDFLSETKKKDPEFADSLKGYTSRAQKLSKAKREQVRTLRDEDVASIQNFRINPKIIYEPPDEITKLARALVESRFHGESAQEQSLRLFRMGLHFLSHSSDSIERLNVGLQVVSQVAVQMCERGNMEGFLSVLTEVQGLKISETGGSEALDQFFSLIYEAKHCASYLSILRQPEHKQKVFNVLKLSLKHSLPLLFKLGERCPDLAVELSEELATSFEKNHEIWKTMAVQYPRHPFYRGLLTKLSQQESPYFSQMAGDFLLIDKWEFKLEVIRILATLDNPHSMKIISRLLRKSESTEQRLQILNEVSAHLCKTKNSMLMLRNWIESPDFADLDCDEKGAGYACLVKLAGAVSWPFFEGLWNASATPKSKKLSKDQKCLMIGLSHSADLISKLKAGVGAAYSGEIAETIANQSRKLKK